MLYTVIVFPLILALVNEMLSQYVSPMSPLFASLWLWNTRLALHSDDQITSIKNLWYW